MDKAILITRPSYDDGTEYLSYYSSLVIKEAKEKGFLIKDFEGTEVNRKEVLKFLEKKDPSALFINGHGDEENLYGHKDKVLLSLRDLGLLRGKMIYARACSAGTVFGKEVTAENGGCFIGYKSPFSFWIDERHSATPHKDNTAKLYLEPSNEVMLSLVKGKTSLEAHNKSKKMMIENMQRMAKWGENNQPGAMNMLQVLWNNFEGQVLHGNDSFRI